MAGLNIQEYEFTYADTKYDGHSCKKTNPVFDVQINLGPMKTFCHHITQDDGRLKIYLQRQKQVVPNKITILRAVEYGNIVKLDKRDFAYEKYKITYILTA